MAMSESHTKGAQALEAEEIMPDPAAPWEWYREMADEDAAPRPVRDE
jgi:hypothetical protein